MLTNNINKNKPWRRSKQIFWNWILDQKEERINEIEHRTFKITQAEEQEEKRMRKNYERLRDLWNTIMWNNISIMRVPEGKEKECRKPIWRNNGCKLTKSEERNWHKIQEAQKLWWDKNSDDLYWDTQIIKNLRQKVNLENEKKQFVMYKGAFYELISTCLSWNFSG